MSPRPVEISKCRICGNTDLYEALDLGDQVLTGRFLAPDDPDPMRGPLRLVLCHGLEGGDYCGLLQLQHTCPPDEMFGETYGYRSSLSPAMLRHLKDISALAIGWAKPVTGDGILDIGCNDGSLLGMFDGLGLKRHGADPSSAKFQAEYAGDIKLLLDYFSAAACREAFGERKYKIITSVAMLYDLDDPMSFMRDIREVLATDGIWVTEQAHMATMFKNMAFDSICHEHLNYYNLKQIEWMASRCGLKILHAELNTINGASFCVVLSRDDADFAADRLAIEAVQSEEENADIGLCRAFADRITVFRRTVRNFFADAKERGEVVHGYGASTKGNVVIQYCELTPDKMPVIAEKYDKKFGLVTPGSRVPIVSEEQSKAANPDYLFVFPWHFRDDIIERELEYLDNGGALVFALPNFEIVRAHNRIVYHKPASRETIPWARPILFGNEKRLVLEALDSTYISGGPFIDRAEAELAQLHGYPAECAITVSNGTAALYLVLLALSIGAGDEVIVPGWGFAAAANMVLTCGAKPVAADVADDSWLLDPRSVAAKISGKTKAIVAIHTFGSVCDLAALREIADKNDIALIEDCAESLFSTVNGRICGTAGDFATYSFQATKTITSGEGGLVLVKDPALADNLRLIRNHGMRGDRKYWHEIVGHNFRLTNMQAAILCAQLAKRDYILNLRRVIWQGYRDRFGTTEGLRFQHMSDEAGCAPWSFAVRLEPGKFRLGRDELIEELEAAGIECRPGFCALSAQPLYNTPALGNSELIAQEVIALPAPPDLSAENLDYVHETFMVILNGDRI